MPLYSSPYGADTSWASTYLPFNSLWRGVVGRIVDPDLANPLLLAVGLVALWRVARRLFPDRSDAVWVTMLLAFTSVQLLTMTMTAYAMTGHFALNMVWLWLLLRDDWRGHAGAALLAIVIGGLHRWHFVVLFTLPFMLWLLLRRRFGPLVLHLTALSATVVLWAKLYPLLMTQTLGKVPFVPAKVAIAKGVVKKVPGVFRRFERLKPMLNLGRFFAWNNILLLPLAALGVAGLRPRPALRGESVVLPLGLGCLMGFALCLDQGHGWGYRYLHGQIGSLCLLAGFGWIRLSGTPARLTRRPVLLASGLALIGMVFLTWQAHRFVAPYARAYATIRTSGADVVVVDRRGGAFMQDVVRFDDGKLTRPIIMDMAQLKKSQIDALCARYDVALFEAKDFLPLGVRAADAKFVGVKHNELQLEYMRSIGCGRDIRSPRR
jgi:hypothetical protein